ncbi:MAG TPA: hypothetical protein VGF68_04895 [Solirubrobacteraceae bacterium]
MSETEQPLYLRVGEETSFAVLHRAPRPSGIAVVLCPPFGWEEVASYRPRRTWAQTLAQAGHTTLRISLPSTGDSGGTVDDPRRVAAWTAAVGAAASWVRRETGARRVVAIGMGLGGMLAYCSAAGGGEIDDLVLWSVGARGRTFIRQLRAFSKLETDQFFEGLPQPAAPPEGTLEAAGFRLSPETVSDLEALDLTTLTLEVPANRRVLMLERDGIAADGRLHDHLAAQGVSVKTAAGEGYAAMTSHPQGAEPAPAVFAEVAEWIAAPDDPPAFRDGGRVPGDVLTADRLDGGDAGWTEVPVEVHAGGVTLRGILTEPSAQVGGGPCAVLLNTGAVRRIGPSRIWVQTARRWAERGIPTLRLDIEAIGDADGADVGYVDDAEFHRPELLAQISQALDAMRDRGVGTWFVLVGLCSGSYWALRLSVSDDRVRAAALLNCRVVVWDEGLAAGRYVRTLVTQRPSLARIRRVASPQLVSEVLRWLAGLPARQLRRLAASWKAGPRESETDRLLGRLRDSGKRVLFVFSEREPLADELERSGWRSRLEQSPGIAVEHIAVNDHTLRPGWAQDQAQATLDRFLGDALGSARTAPLSPTSEPA